MLDIENLTLSYGRTEILSGVTLPRIEAGMLVGILGPNGAGKSTFLRAVSGQCQYAGHIAWNSQSIRDMRQSARSTAIGYMPQMPPAATGFVAYEQVIAACRAGRPDLSWEAIEHAAETVFTQLGLLDLAFRPLNRISGGQRQLIGLAQILVRDPDFLLLDEPSSALDLRWQVGVFELLRERIRHRGGLCLVALHDINLALKYCDRLAVFGGGGIQSFGTPEQAITPDVLRTAYNVEGRIEFCSRGNQLIIVDGTATVPGGGLHKQQSD